MEFLFVIVVAAATFGVCFLADKGFTKLFRNQSQHYSGLSVRLNKKYAVAGTVLGVMGIGAIVTGVTENKALLVGGIIVTLLGVVLILYYMTFGIFYDKESFLYTSFGKKSLTYRYSQICGQQLYIIQGGNIVVELHMNDGKALQVQLHLQGADKFLNRAFAGWCEQKGIDPETCDFHDTANSCWFPTVKTEEM